MSRLGISRLRLAAIARLHTLLSRLTRGLAIESSATAQRIDLQASLSVALAGITLDHIVLAPSGYAILRGWAREGVDLPTPGVSFRGQSLDSRSAYRVPRPDVAAALGRAYWFCGFEIAFGPASGPGLGEIEVTAGPSRVVFTVDWPFHTPHYAALFDTDVVQQRSDIYGSGPPALVSSEDAVALASLLSGRVLDFGCGSGYIVRTLRERGVDAFGIELDRPEIRQYLHHAAEPFVRLYEGGFPLPYPDGAFDGVFCSEVLEHIDDFRGAVVEFARVARRDAVITVPDAAAIPALQPSNVVPWHLLESTHVNFFTAQSLTAVLAPHFRSVKLYKLGRSATNGVGWYESLGAYCLK